MSSVKVSGKNRIPQILQSLRELGSLGVEVGIFAGEAKTKSKDGGESLDYAQIAGIHEFGLTINQNYTSKKTGNNIQRKIVIPERSFIRSTFDENKEKWFQFIERRIPNLLAGQISAYRLCELLGERMVADIQKKITTLNTPPNADSTIKAKGSSNPLIDTSGLRMRVTYKVVKI